MFKYQNTDSDSFNLTSQSGQLNLFLKHYLIPLGWTILQETSNILYLKNSFDQILKIDNQENFATLQGFRKVDDIENTKKGFPTPDQNLELIVCKLSPVLNWTLFATEFFFYFIINSELYGFGTFIPVSFETEKPCFLLGKNALNSTQKLFTNLGIFEISNSSFVSTAIPEIQWSTRTSLSYDQRIDLIASISRSQIVLSTITIHETKNNQARGLLPSIYIVSSKTLLGLDIFPFMRTFQNTSFYFESLNNKIYAFEVT